jgi:hypothetical protein
MTPINTTLWSWHGELSNKWNTVFTVNELHEFEMMNTFDETEWTCICQLAYASEDASITTKSKGRKIEI